ncbi:MAG: DUF92 domain-containing protein, partial [archaeon]
LKKVPRGTNGGVTLLGEVAALFGGVVIALIYFFFVSPNLSATLMIVLAGLIGSNTDSVFGAVFETKNLLNNTQVNMLGSASGAIFCLLLSLLI